MRLIQKLQKISEKKLLEIRKEKLFSWQDKNPKYLSLEEVEEVVLKEIDPILSKTYQSKSLGNLSRYQRDELHSSLFSRGSRKSIIFEAIKTFCSEKEISPQALRREKRHIFDFRATLEKNGLALGEQSTKKYIDSYLQEVEKQTLEEELLLQKMKRRNITSNLKKYLKEGKLELEDFVGLLLKNEDSFEKNLGIKAYADKKASFEGTGVSDEDLPDF